jgi:hypothetical protein
MPSFGVLRYVALVRTDVLEEHIASIIGVTRIGEIGTSRVLWLLVAANDVPSSLMMEAIPSSIMLVLSRATWHNIPEEGSQPHNHHYHHSYLNLAIKQTSEW